MVLHNTHRAQVGALPVRGEAGRYEVLLITSREKQRWVIPKGWPMKGRKDHAAAAREALEEAGVRGTVHRHPVGAYTYDKKIGAESVPTRVMVYLLEVEQEDADWQEASQRRRVWMSASAAALLVEEASLARIIRRVDAPPDAD